MKVKKLKHYNTLKQVVAAADKGKLPEGFHLRVDNDCVFGYVPADDDDEPWAEAFGGYDYDPESLLYEALALLGVKAEPV